MKDSVEARSVIAQPPLKVVPVCNVANILTFFRLAAVPLFAWLFYRSYIQHSSPVWYVVWLVFIIAAITDKLDGYFARKYQLITSLGEFLDPLADKFLICLASALLSVVNKIPWWFTVLVIGRELFVTISRIYLIPRLGVIRASSWGKRKAILQVFVIAWFLIPFSNKDAITAVIIEVIGIFLLAVAAFATIYSATKYIQQWF